MMNGKITGWRRRIKRGKIRLETGEEFPFSLNQITNVTDPKHVRNNMDVSFALKEGKVTEVTILGIPRSPVSIPSPLSEPHPGKFLNPYNFVRNLSKPRPSHHVLGDCCPPPHDRYVGLSGRIVCQIEAITPLFISDTHGVVAKPVVDENNKQKYDAQGRPKKHASYRFFTIKDKNGRPQYAIPATSLRGTLRSIFETITNSCYAVFDGERRLELRERPEYGNKVKNNPGIICKLATPDEDGEVALCLVAEIGAYYDGEDAWKNTEHSKNDITDWASGTRVIARVWYTEGGRYLVKEFAETQDELQPCSGDESYLEGWLKITGRGEGTQKKSEALFLDPDLHPVSGRETLAFNYSQQEEYNVILAGQVERSQLPSGIRLPSKKLQVGDLVWLEKGSGRKVKRLVRVQIPRTPYQNNLAAFLDAHLHCCTDYDSLCPACRLFGWVYQNKPGEKIPDDKNVAYASRISLSYGRLVKESDRYKDIPLAILSTPKPTKAQFYLLNRNGKPSRSVNYNAKGQAQLRGRKMYRHFWPVNSREYVRAPYDDPRRNDQNRTVRGALSPGAIFEFTLYFENLTKLELGALLWALEMEEGMYHRLGYAKPLGFGSVRLTVEQLEIIDWRQRLATLDEANAPPKDMSARKTALRQEFMAFMKQYYGSEYETLLAELRTLLSQPLNMPIHYPRLQEKPIAEGKNFEWFQQHKEETLALASQDEGLPL